MLPESASDVRGDLERCQRRFRLLAMADAVMLGAVAAAVAFAVGVLFAAPTVRAAYLAGSVFVVVAACAGVRWWRAWTLSRVALAVEQRVAGFDNLLVTAEEALRGRTLHPILARELFDQTSRRLRTREGAGAEPPLLGRMALAAAMCAAVAVLVLGAADISPVRSLAPTAREAMGEGPADGALRVTVIPPAYARLPQRTSDNPARVDVLEGSTVRLVLAGARDEVELVEPGREPAAFARVDGTARLELVATTSRALLIRRPAVAGEGADRLLHLHVQPDVRPTVTIEQPARDLLFGTPSGRVPVRIAARDDLNLASLVLRHTRIAGSGETFTFEEGELPLEIQSAKGAYSAEGAKGAGASAKASASASASGTAWRGDGVISLEDLKLQDGDTLVYRALARDHKPGADPSVSETFLIEIGKRSEATSAGFALPDERDRQGLSQQMLIMKTERLMAERSKLPAQAFLERSRLLAIEQRMVRSEFVFMTGGEVQDEVEEAEHAHELVEGRFENQSQAALLTAIREMSRAEARLNAGDTTPALAFERAALTALQRAFDRRRYFLRTLSERTRIDPARRLSGDVTAARSSTRALPPTAEDQESITLRTLLHDVSTAARTKSGLDARLAAGILAADPQSSALQAVAVVIAEGSPPDAKLKAALAAQEALEALLRRRLAVADARQLPRDPLLGHLADRLPRQGPPR